MKKNKRRDVCLAIMMTVCMLAGCGSAKCDAPISDRTENNYMKADDSKTDYSSYQASETESMTSSKDTEIEGSPAYEKKEEAAADESYIEESGLFETEAILYGTYNQDPYNSEEYSAIQEKGFVDTMSEPLSTFSADVDTASYSNVRRMIQDWDYIDPNAVRIEEMINYFDYDYEAPSRNDKFSITKEVFNCPWNVGSKLISVGITTPEIDLSETVPSNFVFLLDVSGSMFSDDKLPLVIDSFSMLTDQLTENDRISIVTYAGTNDIVLKGVSGLQKSKIKDALHGLEAGGSTNGADGILTAYQLAEQYFIKGGNNRVILATDGDLNVGLTSEEELKQLIEKKRESGVFLSVLGFGTGNIKDNKMETLADYGNGNYAYIDSIKEANKVLVQELGSTLFTVAKDVKFQVEFNPTFVKEYRLLGYENRAMAAEDFSDDTKDAGEIGAGHCVTALYEIHIKGKQKNTSDLKYQTIELTDSNELATVSIRYKEPDQDESKLIQKPILVKDYTKEPSEDSEFAACVAQFGMLLRGSRFAGTGTYRDIMNRLSDLKCVQRDEYKKEFMELVSMVNNR